MYGANHIVHLFGNNTSVVVGCTENAGGVSQGADVGAAQPGAAQ